MMLHRHFEKYTQEKPKDIRPDKPFEKMEKTPVVKEGEDIPFQENQESDTFVDVTHIDSYDTIATRRRGRPPKNRGE